MVTPGGQKAKNLLMTILMMNKQQMEHQVIESKTYRRCSYDLIYDGNQYFLLRITSKGIPEVMTYHSTLDEAKIAFDQLFAKPAKANSLV